MVKKNLTIIVLALLAVGAYITTRPSFVLSGTSQIQDLMGLGMSGPLASVVDAQYNSAIEQSPTLGSSSLGFRGVPYVVTAAATPAAGTNDIKPISVIPTAAANTAACLPATVLTGQDYVISNTGPNAVRVYTCNSNSINGVSPGAYVSVASHQIATCVGTTSTNYDCSLSTVPTPVAWTPTPTPTATPTP